MAKTKRQAEVTFRLLHGDTLRKLGKDYTQRSMLWGEYLDNLHQMREITEKQLYSWSTPEWVDPRP